MTALETLREQTRGLDADPAIARISEYIAAHPADDEAWLLRGLRHWGAGHRREAIRDYLEAIRLNPDSRARAALETANAILDFYDKNQFNP